MTRAHRTPTLLLFLGVASAATAAAADLSFVKHLVDGNVDVAIEALPADIDGDGDLDVVGTSFRSSQVAWWENLDGVGQSWAKRTIGTGVPNATGLAVGDIDGDLDLDVVVAARSADDILWFRNNGPLFPWTRNTVEPNFDGARSVDVGDIDGDGDQDIAGAAEFAGEIAWWRNDDGVGTAWTKVSIKTNFPLAHSIRIVDMDEDEDADVLATSETNSDVGWWENTLGDGSNWLKHLVDPVFKTASFAAAGDLDGDGDLDVAATAQTIWELAWYENTNGLATAWEKTTIDTTVVGAIYCHIADLDGDGDLDLMASGLNTTTVTWYENVNGDASAWTRRVIDSDFDGAHSLATADMDDDEDLDVLAAGTFDDQVAWWASEVAPPSDPPIVAGTTTGFNQGTAKCRNKDTNQLVTVSVLANAWNCTVAGFEINVGVDLTLTINATANTNNTTGTLQSVAPTKIICENLTTGLEVETASGQTSYDCAALGLVINSGDRLLVTVNGAATSP